VAFPSFFSLFQTLYASQLGAHNDAVTTLASLKAEQRSAEKDFAQAEDKFKEVMKGLPWYNPAERVIKYMVALFREC